MGRKDSVGWGKVQPKSFRMHPAGRFIIGQLKSWSEPSLHMPSVNPSVASVAKAVPEMLTIPTQRRRWGRLVALGQWTSGTGLPA